MIDLCTGRAGFSASSAIRHHNFKRLLSDFTINTAETAEFSFSAHTHTRPVSVELAMIRQTNL
jgi:hypothetical protein